MKKLFLAGSFLLLTGALWSQTWTRNQLMPTAELAEKLNNGSAEKPLVFNVGPMENIKGAKYVGKGTAITTIGKLKSELSMENKNRTIVLYCGCCSLGNCPNIKDPYDALIAAGFKNTRVLDIPEGIKPDWVAKGYPMEE